MTVQIFLNVYSIACSRGRGSKKFYYTRSEE